MQNLVIVESPTKVKTIKKFLPKGYDVTATYGHIRDLPVSTMGVDIENDFKPEYEISKGKRKTITTLKKMASVADRILIAVDPDREGEAIGWHVAYVLGFLNSAGEVKRNTNGKLVRVVFHEITKPAVLEALEHPREIDKNLVEAQQARRILDRLVGYKLSPLLWKKIRYGLSAGRVQSVALRLIVEREAERDAFKPDEYWTINAFCLVKNTSAQLKIVYRLKDIETKEEYIPEDSIHTLLVLYKGKKLGLKNKNETEKVVNETRESDWVVSNISRGESTKRPYAPFVTSTLQQTAINKFGYTSKKTMSIAQKLYERGLITYMRTDSMSISPYAIDPIRKFISKQYGEEYLSKGVKIFKTTSKNAQEAHEAIRPTDINKTSELIGLSGEEKRLYDLIWTRTLACQMADAKIRTSQIDISASDYVFRTNTQKIIFKGFLAVYKIKIVEQEEPKLEVGNKVYPKLMNAVQHFTEPPARFSEATIIKELEKYGIGRPSTYATIISTVLGRGYVEKIQKYLVPTDTGKVVNRFLVENFEQIVDIDFTAKMEDSLDDIALGKAETNEILTKFYTPFEKQIELKTKSIDRGDYTVLGKSDEKCPECGAEMVIKLGKYGRFYSCSKFPDCKGMKSIETEENTVDQTSKEFTDKYIPAPKTDDGRDFLLKIGRFGKFWAHPDYPKVKEAKPLLLTETCPECGHNLTERQSKWKRTFIGCSNYPKCKFIKKQKKQEEE